MPMFPKGTRRIHGWEGPFISAVEQGYTVAAARASLRIAEWQLNELISKDEKFKEQYEAAVAKGATSPRKTFVS